MPLHPQVTDHCLSGTGTFRIVLWRKEMKVGTDLQLGWGDMWKDVCTIVQDIAKWKCIM